MEGEEGDRVSGGGEVTPGPTLQQAFANQVPGQIMIFGGGPVALAAAAPIDVPMLNVVYAAQQPPLFTSIVNAAQNIRDGNPAVAFVSILDSITQNVAQKQDISQQDLMNLATIVFARAQQIANNTTINLGPPLAFQLDNWGGAYGQAPGGGRFAFAGTTVPFAGGGATVGGPPGSDEGTQGDTSSGPGVGDVQSP